MTISMDPHYTTVKLPDGGIKNAPSGVEFHFHGPVTLNYMVVTPNDARGMLEEEGGEDEQWHEPDADATGPGILSPLVCDTRALPVTHPRNGEKSWLMKNHPAYQAARRAAAAIEAAEAEEAAEIEPAIDERSRWQRLLRRTPAPVE